MYNIVVLVVKALINLIMFMCIMLTNSDLRFVVVNQTSIVTFFLQISAHPHIHV
jgi:hypothetical protein